MVWQIVRCEVFPSRCQSDGARGMPVWGLRLTMSDGRCWQWEDVSERYAVAQSIADRLTGEWVDPVQLAYLLEDLLAEETTSR